MVMAAAAAAVTGFFFEIARDVLKDVIKSAVDKQLKAIFEEEVRSTVIDRVSQSGAMSPQVVIDVETINIIVKEVYAIAGNYKDLQVSDNRIQILPPPLFQMPEKIKEIQISRRVQSFRSELLELASQEVQPLIQNTPEDVQPLMFESSESEDKPEIKAEIPDTVRKYRDIMRDIMKEEG